MKLLADCFSFMRMRFSHGINSGL
uniref:Uncharacterized protein n=1 Tax=mine drainage metagenome TaxID=410659 RepID=E6QG58_9ZZZZ